MTLKKAEESWNFVYVMMWPNREEVIDDLVNKEIKIEPMGRSAEDAHMTSISTSFFFFKVLGEVVNKGDM